MKDLLRSVEAASQRAGDEVMRWYGAATLERRAKADASPVTSADLASHEILTKSLEVLTPGVPIVSEESGTSPREMLEVVRRASEFWLVDPLDGTRDFLAGTGEFCTCVAFVRGGRPVLGVIYAPVTRRTYAGAGGLTNLRTRVAPAAPVFLVSRQHPGGEEEKLRRAIPQAVVERLGSALKYARIAAGEADASVRFTPTSLWDLAAGQAILEAAGGGIRTLAGGPLDYSGQSLTHPPFVAAGDLAMLDRFADQLMHALD